MENSVTIGRRDNAIILLNNQLKVGIAFSWQATDELVRCLRITRPGERNSADSDTAVVGTLVNPVDEQDNGERWVIEFKSSVFIIVDAAASDAVCQALSATARRVEEEEAHEQVAFDQALLLRSGAPFGLTNNEHIQQEAKIEAQSNPTLRRAIVGGIRSEVQLGTPSLIQHQVDEPWLARLVRMSPVDRGALLELLQKERENE